MELLVETDYSTGASRFYLRDRRGDQIVLFGYENGAIVEQTLDPTTLPEKPVIPMLQLPLRFSDQFVKAFLEWASGRNIKTENENLLQGKLAATEKHLEDMRKHFEKVLDKVISND